MAGVGLRPGRRLSRALSRAGADGRGGRRRATGPASLSMWLLAVTRSSGTAQANRRGWPVQRCRRLFCRSRSQSRARLRRVGASHRRPLSSDLARQTHWHLSGWTGQSRGRKVRNLGAIAWGYWWDATCLTIAWPTKRAKGGGTAFPMRRDMRSMRIMLCGSANE